jgi:hypothetical protein
MYAEVTGWLNQNQGTLAVILFAITLILGWVSGIFAAIRKRPKFEIDLMDGPTFCCTYPTGQMHGEYEIHRTGIALYLSITNSGSAASDIKRISVGYHWHLKPFSVLWLKNTLGWFWLTTQAVALDDFQVRIGNRIKVYPFLTQRNNLSPVDNKSYLQIGELTKGVVYFEQEDSWGGCFPSIKSNRVKVKVRVQDVFGKQYSRKFWIQAVPFAEALKYNPSFGQTLAELRGEELPGCAESNKDLQPTVRPSGAAGG